MDNRRLIAAIDIGQATTQAVLFESVGLSLRLLGLSRRANPVDDHACIAPVLRDALTELAARTRTNLLDAGGAPLLAPPDSADGSEGPTAWYVTADSSGPFRVAVAGVIDDISGLSALKAALSAGGAVADLMAINDDRTEHQKVRELRSAPIDAVLLAGGVDEGLYAGGGGRQVVNVAKFIAAAAPRLRHDPTRRAGVIFAGSAEARADIADVLDGTCEVMFADNVRPDMALENLEGAKQVLLEAFQSRLVPGRDKWRGVAAFAGPSGVQPTGLACSAAAELLAAAWRANILVTDIGEATLNIYSVIERQLNRTVTDELGLNYGCPQDISVLVDAVAAWSPLETPRDQIANILGLARRRPAALPLTWLELLVRQCAARERLRAGLEAHRRVASLIKGVRRQRNLDEVFGQYVSVGGQTIVDLSTIKVILATGRLVAAATTPGQVLGMILDGVGPQGLTQILWDPAALMPHIGALAAKDEALAAQVLAEEWFDRLAVVVAPTPIDRGGTTRFRRQGQRLARVRVERENGAAIQETVDFGVVKRIPLEPGEFARVTVYPDRGQDAGAGFGTTSRLDGGGVLGVVLDGRGRPIALPGNPVRRRARAAEWLRIIEAYPDQVLAGGEASRDA